MNAKEKINIVMREVPKDNMYFQIWNETQSIDVLNTLYTEILTSTKPIAFQSLAMLLGYSANLQANPANAFDYGAKTLINLEYLGLYEINKGRGLSIKKKFLLEPETIKALNKKNYSWKKPKLKRQGDRVILGKNNHHKGKQAIDVLNTLQSIEFKLDFDILSNFKDNDLFDTEQFLNIASNLLGTSFNFEWKYDKRGRCYSTGYDIQLQGNEYKKALISLANKEVVKL